MSKIELQKRILFNILTLKIDFNFQIKCKKNIKNYLKIRYK